MVFDSHCHIQFSQYDADREELINACNQAGVGGLCVGCDLDSSKKAVEFASKHNNFWSSIGVHPTEWGAVFPREEFEQFLQLSKKIVAIGETGLDYYRISSQLDSLSVDQSANSQEEIKDWQKNLFKEHISFAKEKNLPLIIHCRDAQEDTKKILTEQFPVNHEAVIPDLIRDPENLFRRLPARGGSASGGDSHLRGNDKKREYGVLHCFSGNTQDAQKYLELGFCISFTGIITFAKQYDEVIHNIPLEKILIETDAPFLTPVPYRGKRNNPMYVEYVARRIAEIKSISYEEVVEQTWKNAQRLFSLFF